MFGAEWMRGFGYIDACVCGSATCSKVGLNGASGAVDGRACTTYSSSSSSSLLCLCSADAESMADPNIQPSGVEMAFLRAVKYYVCACVRVCVCEGRGGGGGGGQGG